MRQTLAFALAPLAFVSAVILDGLLESPPAKATQFLRNRDRHGGAVVCEPAAVPATLPAAFPGGTPHYVCPLRVVLMGDQYWTYEAKDCQTFILCSLNSAPNLLPLDCEITSPTDPPCTDISASALAIDAKTGRPSAHGGHFAAHLKAGLKVRPSVADSPKPADNTVKPIHAHVVEIETSPDGKKTIVAKLFLHYADAKVIGKLTLPPRFIATGHEVNNDKKVKPDFRIKNNEIVAVEPGGHACHIQLGSVVYPLIVHQETKITTSPKAPGGGK
jgi:hypothetical protein